MRTLVVGVLAVIAVATGGCSPGFHHQQYHRRGHIQGAGIYGVAVGVAVGSAIAAAAAEEPEHVQHVHYWVNGAPPPVTPASKRDAVPRDEDLPPFDPQLARSAMNAIDVSECRAAGAPSGYGHARVTINPDGRASKVIVEEPAKLEDPAVQCIGGRLGKVTVPPFKGSFVTMGTTFRVP